MKKDITGKEIKVGDKVIAAVQQPHFNKLNQWGKPFMTNFLVFGEVIKLTEHKIWIIYQFKQKEYKKTIRNPRNIYIIDKTRLITEKFVKDNKITCPETISQVDRVIVNAYDFIEELCDEVGYMDYREAYPEDD